MSPTPLQIIAKYNMTIDEGNAFKLCVIFSHLVQKMFPTIRPIIFNGDPRKKEIFKYCWKAVQETQGKLHPTDYKLFVMAQLKILKKHMTDTNIPRVHPNCLCGIKAWNRWLVFKNHMDKRQQYETVEETKINIHEGVAKALADTKKFLQLKFQRHRKEDILAAMEDGSMKRWFVNKQVSGYYVLLSPLVRQFLSEKKTIEEFFGDEINVYRGGINSSVEEHFKRDFGYEYE